MSMNAIQFQRGLSLPQFQALYGREDRCERALALKRQLGVSYKSAWQTTEDGRPLYMRLTPVADFTNQQIGQSGRRHLAAHCHVVSDGTPAFAQVRHVGAMRERHVTAGGRQGARTPQPHWFNTLLSNLKTSMAGTYHSFDHARYAARYLAEFCYRFNRGFDLPAVPPGLLRALATAMPLPLKVLRVSS